MKWLLSWLKAYGAKKLIRELDMLNPIIEAKLTEAQQKFGKIPPKEFAVTLVDEIQTKLCEWAGVDPKEVV